jgi:hypothetical protein
MEALKTIGIFLLAMVIAYGTIAVALIAGGLVVGALKRGLHLIKPPRD